MCIRPFFLATCGRRNGHRIATKLCGIRSRRERLIVNKKRSKAKSLIAKIRKPVPGPSRVEEPETAYSRARERERIRRQERKEGR